ncbi:glycoside hydrolase family 133 protein [Piedraia hortae CBS 480.64]|uniref:Glycogen debranching enzyme n=1 Tax=Piedraia hortae CBS 480.64 TaxID=1314780 RepID=A0A6A7C168_9PEZI|nr:glycoside hydrolase family 133 protein [Piedraia hortae CBS 480.64]
MAPRQITHLLPLKNDGSPDLAGEPPYIYLPPPTDPPYSIRFKIGGTSSICRNGSLWVNLPGHKDDFVRSKFQEFKLTPSFNNDIEIDVPVYAAGAFTYYCTYTPLPEFSTEPVEAPKPTKTCEYHIDIEPSLQVQGEKVPLDAISIISVLSKLMGKYPDDFYKHLQGISERGYNMVHFTPLMTRGESNSPYSIYDQLAFDQEMFPNGTKDVAELLETMETKYNLLSMTDVVLNHTANNSAWLKDHPDAGYNLVTAPHLRPALELDTALLKYSDRLAELGLPTRLTSFDDLQRVMGGVKEHVVSVIKLWEFYVCNVDDDAQAACAAWKAGPIDEDAPGLENASQWSAEQKANWVRENAFQGKDRMGERFRRRVAPKTAAALLQRLVGKYDPQNIKTAVETMKAILNDVNVDWYREYDNDVETIIKQLSDRIKYTRLDDHGPKQGEITSKFPLAEPYFTRLEAGPNSHPDELALANNGWVWAADVLRDHAGPDSRVYLRRELIPWGDCVKLRYGSKPEDSPFLWKFMTEYVQLMAKHFHGFRIDNCHSTPLHVAEPMLDAARRVRPNLVVAAELFSGSEAMDFLYCQRLGLSCLIREAMQCWSTAEMSRIVHINSGRPIGSFDPDETSGADVPEKAIVHNIIPSKLHALLMDCTHDNETPVQKRDGRDTLPNAALVAMCASASGSVFGYDELYPELIDLVQETRLYSSPYSRSGAGVTEGIGGIKRLLNRLHNQMGREGYDESFLHHDGEYITIHRMHPKTRRGYYLIAHTAYPGCSDGGSGLGAQHLAGTKVKPLGAWTLVCDQSDEAKKAAKTDKVLRGVPSHIEKLEGARCESKGEDTFVHIPEHFPPGSIALFETSVPAAEQHEGLEQFCVKGAREAFAACNHIDLNAILYRADAEERAMSGGADGAYAIPNMGALVYCGLQGWWSILRNVIAHNDLGHPLADHLRQGTWALDYIVGRLDKLAKKDIYSNLSHPADWLRQRFNAARILPNFLLPRVFAIIVGTAYRAAFERGLELMSDNIRGGQRFLQQCAMVSCQMQGYMENASLWPDKLVPSLAAGLPHFAQDWARCWGRDITISMRGLLLCTGRYADAREHLLALSSVVYMGMVPNLVGSGKSPRYNSRDSVWFFLQNMQDYTLLVPDGLSILKEKVKRRFLPYDDTWFPWDDERAYSVESSVADVIQECMQRHASGIHAREANAGPQIDSQMKDDGFNIDIELDEETGFLFGGNEHNCGTWMDKMGESEKAGNKGEPGTSRDGAPVEITGLLYSAVYWLSNLSSNGDFPHSGVQTSKDYLGYYKWALRIKSNFGRCYFVPTESSEWHYYDINPSLVNRRGIYKDVYRGKKEYRDYQLRPNFPIAMVVAPDLFDCNRALKALESADRILRGPIGMATLDPSDHEYRPYYINSEDSTDYLTAKGRNYHQGPEWCWPLSFFLRAMLFFDLQRRKTEEGKIEVYQQITERLRPCMKMIEEGEWAGLTELTNKDGALCHDSCPTQAWSASGVVDVFFDASGWRWGRSEGGD